MGRKKTSKEIIGKRLKEILDSKNYSISKLAIKIGYTREAISKSINNNKMDTTMLDIICKFFNVSPRYIEGIEKDITTYNVYSVTDTLVQSSSNKYDLLQGYLEETFYIDDKSKEKKFLKKLVSSSAYVEKELQNDNKKFLSKLDNDIHNLINQYAKGDAKNGKCKKENS